MCLYGKHLYVLRMGELVKIGRSMDVKRSVSEIRNANPWGDITLVATFEDAGHIEPWVLKALSGHERRSGWVHCTVAEALKAVGECLL